ncbi:MAG: TraB/GumN family protein [Syntrophobacterales bacterium]|nr:TraB/GumN family protein [Syntrophobacterales bacterium]
MKRKNIHHINIDDREVILIGTAHISRESADLVEQVIEEEKPDTVCIELCKSRYEAIKQKENWEKTDIFKVIKEKRTFQLLAQLLMASFQKRLADKFGITPGEEMLRAINKAEETGAEVVLADRDIRVTMSRTWRLMRFFSKIKILVEIFLSIFSTDEITEKEIEELKEHDALELALKTFGKKAPEVKMTLIDERDEYLAHSITHAPGSKIVAVVGAGHVPGTLKHLGREIDLFDITKIPPKGILGKVLAWGISLAVIGLIITGFFHSGAEASLNMIKWWVSVNGILAGLGALLVLAHPITIAASVAAAPLTSLNPMVAAGWVAGLVEVSIRKPQVKDFIDLRGDISTVRGFWHNKITRILLLVVFVNLGSSIGTFIAIPLMIRFLQS